MVYAYLGSKEDLFAACIRREATRLMEAIAAGVGEAGDRPDVQLWHGLRAFFGFVGEYRDSWRVLHRQASAQGGPFAQELLDMRRRAISLVAALLMNTSDSEASLHADAMAAALVGAGESLADWWLDHPEESAGTVAARLMNLVWMGFGNLVDGQMWQPPG
jgi:AcrR family transcriptional regulator